MSVDGDGNGGWKIAQTAISRYIFDNVWKSIRCVIFVKIFLLEFVLFETIFSLITFEDFR